jgi:hypothetical protein
MSSDEAEVSMLILPDDLVKGSLLAVVPALFARVSATVSCALRRTCQKPDVK